MRNLRSAAPGASPRRLGRALTGGAGRRAGHMCHQTLRSLLNADSLLLSLWRLSAIVFTVWYLISWKSRLVQIFMQIQSDHQARARVIRVEIGAACAPATGPARRQPCQRALTAAPTAYGTAWRLSCCVFGRQRAALAGVAARPRRRAPRLLSVGRCALRAPGRTPPRLGPPKADLQLSERPPQHLTLASAGGAAGRREQLPGARARGHPAERPVRLGAHRRRRAQRVRPTRGAARRARPRLRGFLPSRMRCAKRSLAQRDRPSACSVSKRLSVARAICCDVKVLSLVPMMSARQLSRHRSALSAASGQP